MQWAKQKQGFTIVELLIVVVVIAVLAAITIVAYNGIQKRAYWSRIYSETHAVAMYLGTYQVENGVYPTTDAAVKDIFKQANVATATGWTYGYCATDTKYYLFPANTKAGAYGVVGADADRSYRQVYEPGSGWYEMSYPNGPELVADRVCGALFPGAYFVTWAHV